MVAGDKSEPLTDLITFEDGQFGIDAQPIRRMVDSATTKDPHYTPTFDRRAERKLGTQAMHEYWRKAYRELRKLSPNQSDVWYSRRIARTDIARGRDADTIRKRIKTRER